MENLVVGKKFTKHVTVKKDLLASQVGSGDADVFSTPMLINEMESASSQLLKAYLSPDMTSVGMSVDIKHLAPTLEGVEVKTVSELVNIEDRKYEFYIEAFDNAGIIAKGTHTRVVLNKDRFMEKAKQRREIPSNSQ